MRSNRTPGLDFMLQARSLSYIDFSFLREAITRTHGHFACFDMQRPWIPIYGLACNTYNRDHLLLILEHLTLSVKSSRMEDTFNVVCNYCQIGHDVIFYRAGDNSNPAINLYIVDQFGGLAKLFFVGNKYSQVTCVNTPDLLDHFVELISPKYAGQRPFVALFADTEQPKLAVKRRLIEREKWVWTDTPLSNNALLFPVAGAEKDVITFRTSQAYDETNETPFLLVLTKEELMEFIKLGYAELFYKIPTSQR